MLLVQRRLEQRTELSHCLFCGHEHTERTHDVTYRLTEEFHAARAQQACPQLAGPAGGIVFLGYARVRLDVEQERQSM